MDRDLPEGPSFRRPTSADAAALERRAAAYWRRNLTYLVVLLSMWAVVSFGFGIVFAEALNEYRVPFTRFPLGFWFAQQGSIYVFVVLIFVYVRLMNRLDRAFGLSEEEAA
jgi:putative solute:sodium symporter small subunit